MSERTWKRALEGKIREDWGREIDVYETQIELRKKRKIEEKLFAETRLRRGVYGQRYDNGQRHDGEKTQALAFPCDDLTKGPIGDPLRLAAAKATGDTGRCRRCPACAPRPERFLRGP